MRIVIVVLIGLCVWLAADRHTLSQGVGTLESRVSRLQKEKIDLEKKLAVATAYRPEDPQPHQPRKTWLQERIEQGSSALEVSPSPTYLPRYPVVPANRPITPNSRLIR